MTAAVVDNDILAKGAAFEILERLIAAIPAELAQTGILGAARYVVSAKLKSIPGTGAAQKIFHFETLIQKMILLEPTTAETQAAAEIELAAQLSQLELDTGESQLCAIVIARAIPFLVTGDKRAIIAIEALLERPPMSRLLVGKVICLEQLFQRLLESGAGTDLRDVVCQNPNVDRTLSMCFGCASNSTRTDWMSGLRSYIVDLRKSAVRTLVP